MIVTILLGDLIVSLIAGTIFVGQVNGSCSFPSSNVLRFMFILPVPCSYITFLQYGFSISNCND